MKDGTKLTHLDGLDLVQGLDDGPGVGVGRVVRAGADGATQCGDVVNNGTSGGTAANPRNPNPYGHIIRWMEKGGDKTALYRWDSAGNKLGERLVAAGIAPDTIAGRLEGSAVRVPTASVSAVVFRPEGLFGYVEIRKL